MAAVAAEPQHPLAGRPQLRVAGSGAASGRRLPARVYHRRRAAVAAAVATIVVVLVVGLMSGGAPPALRDVPASGPVATVVVGPGDTLWELLAPHAPAGAHPTAYVLEVAAFNGVDPRTVTPGTVLRLPAVQP